MKYLSTELHPYPRRGTKPLPTVAVVLPGNVHVRVSREAMRDLPKGHTVRLRGKYHASRNMRVSDFIRDLEKVDPIGAERIKTAYLQEHPEELRNLMGRF